MSATNDFLSVDVTRAAEMLFALRHGRENDRDEFSLKYQPLETPRHTLKPKKLSNFNQQLRREKVYAKGRGLTKPKLKYRQHSAPFEIRTKLKVHQKRNEYAFQQFAKQAKKQRKSGHERKRNRKVSRKDANGKKKIPCERNPTSEADNRLIDRLQKVMDAQKLNQSEISKIVGIPQPYISMFLKRRWRGSFDSPTWIRMVGAVSNWLKGEKTPPNNEPVKSVKLETQSPILKPEREASGNSQLRSKLLPSFMASTRWQQPPGWCCESCTYQNKASSIECKICGKHKSRL
eukprot:CAMPEP_0114508348 /NCGR_PEP_ID=MMETSP0109-20121206/12550_1 /TAXON_ID=29199 /ORGANISM="Chlorarachnion reptans, Strain CCCM449" /LENGTH=289 /DNA_ID=CAMNT_0001687271 /DNA_START=172 /DNA_END=1041 /DNA_ORIENTATION=+